MPRSLPDFLHALPENLAPTVPVGQLDIRLYQPYRLTNFVQPAGEAEMALQRIALLGRIFGRWVAINVPAYLKWLTEETDPAAFNELHGLPPSTPYRFRDAHALGQGFEALASDGFTAMWSVRVGVIQVNFTRLLRTADPLLRQIRGRELAHTG